MMIMTCLGSSGPQNLPQYRVLNPQVVNIRYRDVDGDPRQMFQLLLGYLGGLVLVMQKQWLLHSKEPSAMGSIGHISETMVSFRHTGIVGASLVALNPYSYI